MIDDPARFTITEASPKAGKTLSHLEWLLESSIKAGQGHWWWIATVNETTDIAFRRAKDRLKGVIDSGGQLKKVSEPIPFIKNDTRKFIVVNNATIWFKSADEPDSLFGEDVRGAVGDEVTRWKEAAWIAVYTTLTATRGRAKLIGNVKGRKNFAFKLARKAEMGEPNWGYHRLTADDAIRAGIIDQAVVDQAKRDLSESTFQELYYAEATEDGCNPFGLQAIRDCIAPISNQPVICWGVDLGRKRDWTVAIGLDREGKVAAFSRWLKFPLWAQAEAELIRIIGDIPAAVDSTGVGDRVVEALQDKSRNIEGFIFTQKSKQQLMELLEITIQSKEITYPEGPISIELESFEFEHTRTGVYYGAPSGEHDDCVIALGLARHKYKELEKAPQFGSTQSLFTDSRYDRPSFDSRYERPSF